MDAAAEQPDGGIIHQPTPEDATETAPEPVAGIEDEGIAPIAAEAAEVPEVAPEIAETPAEEIQPGVAPDGDVAEAEMEVFYTFTWGRQPRGNQNQRRGVDNKPRGKGKPQGKGKKGGPRGDKGGKAQNFSARPPKKEKAIDPDNPFAAALMGLKDDK